MKRTSIARKAPPMRPVKTYEHFTMKPRYVALRIPDGRDRATVQVPKAKPVRSEPYRRLVAAMPCINCGKPAPSQCAHGPSLGRGIKCDDRLTFPLCAEAPGHVGCHWLFDNYRIFGHVRDEMAASWAVRTRSQIIAAKLWPERLPFWKEGAT